MKNTFEKTPSLSLRLRVGGGRFVRRLFGACSDEFGFRSVAVQFPSFVEMSHE
jgi:hypothetical protein